ncbi:MAG: LysR substrate-binding domain-containing protein, partial [Myxococcota bacterium]|nr:LysR substrate-binding domain-containing protein [Myxococcota bacterium]
ALTDAGAAMLGSGDRVSAEFEQLGRRLVGHDARLSGVVRVTFPGSFTTLVHAAMAAFVVRHPRIEIELSTLDAMVDVDGRQADVAIRVAAAPPGHLVGSRIARLAGALYATRNYLAAHGDPLESSLHAWVDWDRRLSSKPALAWVHQRFPERRILARGLSTEDVLQAVLAGMGVGPLPCLVGDREPSLVRLLDAPRPAWSSVWLLTHAELKPAARVRAVLDHLALALRGQRSRIEGGAAIKERASGEADRSPSRTPSNNGR